VLHHNSYYGIVGSGFTEPGAGSITADPRLVNPPSDLRLQSDSPAKNAGDDGKDMGANPDTVGTGKSRL
jgi:hypothetical protein